jgi:hypothetical protein
MSKTFYRFRSINNLLGEFDELEKQNIYFAHPEQLNDPMEGFRDVYWSGDLIVWKNIFKHYLFCLERVSSLFIVAGEDIQLSNDDIPIFSGIDDFQDPKYKELFIKISGIFFSHENIVSLIKKISSRTTPIRSEELFFYLNTIHPIALETIFSVHEDSNLILPLILPIRAKNMGFVRCIFIYLKYKYKKLKTYRKSTIPNTEAHKILGDLLKYNFFGELEKLLDEQDCEEKINAFFSTHKDIHHQENVIRLHNGLITSDAKNKNLLLIDFPNVYINQLEKLIYPNWYTACFMSDCSNSSVWGHYGDNHSGVCLMFKSETEGENSFLNLEVISGWGSDGARYEFSKFQLNPINYTKGYGSIDFFRSLGTLTMPKLYSTWYIDGEQMSSCAEDIRTSEKEWRDNYWKNFYRDITIKSKDWEYEKEYRLILNNMGGSFSKKENRLLKYNFESLEGLIFGIKTKNEDKAKVIEVVKRKCKETNREDFKFFQAYYSHEKKCIDFTELHLLK